jgi:3-phosphoshikimate 1-carboxyvinyltransferase
MRARIQGRRRIEGRVEVPGDKSIGHRAVLLGALARGTTRIANLGLGDDVRSSLACVAALGVGVRRDGACVTIESPGRAAWPRADVHLDAGNSGTTARLLMGMLAPCEGLSATIVGDGSLSQRPMRRVSEPLARLGGSVSLTGGRTLPARVAGRKLSGARLQVDVPSAQVKTALLLAGLGASGETWLAGTGGRDHTERMLPAFGAEVLRDASGAIGVRGADLVAPGALVTVPGDPSSSAFFAVAAAVTGGRVTVPGLCLNPTRTGAFGLLRAMGADATEAVTDRALDVSGLLEVSGGLPSDAALTFDADDAIDEVPVLAVAAACRPEKSRTVFTNCGELRVKESDRLRATVDGLRAMGATVDEAGEGFTVAGGGLRGGRVDAGGDHRIAMAFAVAGLAAAGETVIEGAECVSVSFPSFFDLLSGLGADVEVAS